jgi:LmbE family N-acetylglucosaminyl deacetylase
VRHVYLAPHLDDAVLSCGGAIHRLANRGEAVQVITIFAADGEAVSPFALEQHDYWGNPPRPMALRRAEDVAALARLNAAALHLDYADAVYRALASGEWPYHDLESLMGKVHPADPVDALALAPTLAEALEAGGQPPDAIYAPLAIGHHVDHQIVHDAARHLLAEGYRVAFYEDYPYAESAAATAAALTRAGAAALTRAGAGDLTRAGAGDWPLEIVALEPVDLVAKVSALGYYRSQLPVLFGGAEAMPSRVWAFAAGHAPEGSLAERLWWPPAGEGTGYA